SNGTPAIANELASGDFRVDNLLPFGDSRILDGADRLAFIAGGSPSLSGPNVSFARLRPIDLLDEQEQIAVWIGKVCFQGIPPTGPLRRMDDSAAVGFDALAIRGDVVGGEGHRRRAETLSCLPLPGLLQHPRVGLAGLRPHRQPAMVRIGRIGHVGSHFKIEPLAIESQSALSVRHENCNAVHIGYHLDVPGSSLFSYQLVSVVS